MELDIVFQIEPVVSFSVSSLFHCKASDVNLLLCTPTIALLPNIVSVHDLLFISIEDDSSLN